MKLYQYSAIYDFMADCVQGDPYEVAHAQRVLCNVLQIAKTEQGADARVLIAAALLHDIGRGEAAREHAVAGSEKAYVFLRKSGYPKSLAGHIAECILTHSYASGAPPRSIEARILFDADKLDLTGALGTARAIEHCVLAREPLYVLGENGLPGLGKKGEGPSLLRAYRKKLKNLPAALFTATARKIAENNRQIQDAFFAHLAGEAKRAYAGGAKLLKAHTVRSQA
ncbi:MAG: HD domain-containing protein [Deltaproteobacteria bacterium]|jgi:uncharacterized protein|nr:HD domain-containing protein [Deltaproteobacteria bacterium]